MKILGLKEVLVEHILNNKIKYILICISLIAGLSTGVFLTFSIPYEKSVELNDFVKNFCVSISEGPIHFRAFTSTTILNNFRLFVLFLICSFHVFLIPLIFFAVAVKGFVIGFSTCFMCINFGFWGFILIASSNIIQMFILIPVCMYMAIQSININKRRRDFLRAAYDGAAIRSLNWGGKNYTLSCAFCIIAIFICSFIEIAVVPSLVRAITGFII